MSVTQMYTHAETHTCISTHTYCTHAYTICIEAYTCFAQVVGCTSPTYTNTGFCVTYTEYKTLVKSNSTLFATCAEYNKCRLYSEMVNGGGQCKLFGDDFHELFSSLMAWG